MAHLRFSLDETHLAIPLLRLPGDPLKEEKQNLILLQKWNLKRLYRTPCEILNAACLRPIQLWQSFILYSFEAPYLTRLRFSLTPLPLEDWLSPAICS